MRRALAQLTILVLFTASGALCVQTPDSSAKAGHGCCKEKKNQRQDPMRCCTLSSSSPKVTVAAKVPDFAAVAAQSVDERSVPLVEFTLTEPISVPQSEKRFLLLHVLRL